LAPYVPISRSTFLGLIGDAVSLANSAAPRSVTNNAMPHLSNPSGSDDAQFIQCLQLPVVELSQFAV
jgi:hypothetical protein